MKGLLNRDQTLVFSDKLARPSTVPDKAVVQEHYASLHPTDLDTARGAYDFLLWLAGVRGEVRTGFEFSGVVSQGAGSLSTGDRVFGYTNVMKGPKTHQQEVVLDPHYAVRLPDEVSLAQGAAFAVGAMTAQHVWKSIAELQPGHEVLIIGGSGGVGIYAIQIARLMQAKVTAVAGPAGQELMRRMGASVVIDYRKQDVTHLGQQYDAVLDLTCTKKFKDIADLLTPRGKFIPADPMKNLLDFCGNIWRRKRTKYLYVSEGKPSELRQLAELVEAGELQVPAGQT